MEYSTVSGALIETIRQNAVYATSNVNNPDLINEFIELLGIIRVKQRLYFISADAVSGLIWPLIRENEDLLDLIINMTIDWTTRLGSLSVTTINDHLAQTFTSLATPDVTDVQFVEMLNKQKKSLVDLLNGNYWLTFIIIASQNIKDIKDKFTVVQSNPQPPRAR